MCQWIVLAFLVNSCSVFLKILLTLLRVSVETNEHRQCLGFDPLCPRLSRKTYCLNSAIINELKIIKEVVASGTTKTSVMVSNS